MVEVIFTYEFESWWNDLTAEQQEDVAVVVDILEVQGVTLGYPHSSAIKDSRFPLREIRVQSAGRPIRVFYAFDPRQRAALLIGGDKTGQDRFYEEMIPKAEAIWKEYIWELEQE